MPETMNNAKIKREKQMERDRKEYLCNKNAQKNVLLPVY